jgi:hypothetical protein
MKTFPVIAALLLTRTLSSAAEPPAVKGTVPPVNPAPVIRSSQAPAAWLGLEITKPDETITAQLPSLPPGIGFVVRVIERGGPAESAGLQVFDVLWKIGDQMLVNEAQLAALLRLSKPGDDVTLSGFRAGKPLEVKLKLGLSPHPKLPFPHDLVESAILPGGGVFPTRVINVSDKLASYSTDAGRAEVRKDGEVYKVKIEDPKDQMIFQGDLATDGNLDNVPEYWRRRVHALRRGLDQALEGRMMPSRQPRPRVVPPTAKNP